MKDFEIEEFLTFCIDKYLAVPGEHYQLEFNDPGEDGGYHAYYDYREGCWAIGGTYFDPLSAYILYKRPRPDEDDPNNYRTIFSQVKNKSTDYIVAGLLDKSIWWPASFQDGWYGRSNCNQSIGGYILGRKLRLRYMRYVFCLSSNRYLVSKSKRKNRDTHRSV